MADNTVLNAGSGGDTIATEDRGSYKTPISLIDVGGRTGAEAIIGDSGVSMPVRGLGTAGTANSGVVTIQGIASMTPVQIADNSGSITVDDGGSSLTVDGSVSISGSVAVTDNSGSITVDAPVATPVFVRLSDGTSAITALPITDNSGSITVDNAGTFAVQAAQSGTWTVTGSGGTFPVTDSGGSLTIDNATLSTTGGGLETGALRVTIASDSTGVLSVDDNGGSLTVDGTVAATQSGTWNIGTVTGVTTVSTVTNLSQMGGAAIAMGTGTRSAGTQRVTIATDDVVPASQSGTWNISTCSVVSSLTGSGVQHDNADSGNPHKIGAKATTALSGLTLVASADRTDLFAGIDGVLIIRPHCNLEDIVSGVAAITDGSSTSVIAAQGAGIKTYVSSVTITNTSASAVTVDLRDGTAGSVKWTFPAPADTGGVTHRFDPPLPFSANTIVAADPSAAASTVTVSILGFRSRV